MLKVSFVLCEHMLATSVSLPLEQLRAAEALAQADTPRRRQQDLLSVKLLSVDGTPVNTHTGICISPDSAIVSPHDNATAYS